MKKYTYLVLASPKEGREEEWLNWHHDQHWGDMIAVPGVKRVKRFKAADVSANADAKWKYMVLWEIETDDIEGVFKEMGERFGTERMPATDASDLSKGASETWTLISEQDVDA